MRDWDKFDDDEIITIWKGFLQTEFPNYNNPLLMTLDHHKPGTMRLTPLEIVKLVEELMKRLEMKLRKQEVELKND
jgi:hypothetical protein